jgi:ribonuclease HII
MSETSERLFAFDRDLHVRYVCGADEAGRAAWAGPLVAAAVRFDCEHLDAAAQERLDHLNDSKKVSPARRAALLPVIMEVADMVAVVVVSAAGIDRGGGVDVANRRALAGALGAVAVPGSVNLVDWYELTAVDGWRVDGPRVALHGGDGKSAAIAAASIVAKETRDQLMRGLEAAYPGYGFADHKGYGGGKVSTRRRSGRWAASRRCTEAAAAARQSAGSTASPPPLSPPGAFRDAGILPARRAT